MRDQRLIIRHALLSLSFVLLFLFLNRPEVIVPFATQKFDESGRLTDEATRQFVAQHVAELVRHTRVLTHSH